MRRAWFTLLRSVYHLRVVVSELLYRYRHIDAQPIPPPVCQICGKPGHKEKYCPNAKGLGF